MTAGLLNNIRSNIVGYIAIFLYLTTGTAYQTAGGIMYADAQITAVALSAS